MSLQKLEASKDLVNIKTQNYRPKTRGESTNLRTDDIDGKFQSKFK